MDRREFILGSTSTGFVATAGTGQPITLPHPSQKPWKQGASWAASGNLIGVDIEDANGRKLFSIQRQTGTSYADTTWAQFQSDINELLRAVNQP